MKKLVLAVALVCLAAAAVTAIVIPSVPRLITYQGRLTDALGNPLTGAYLVRFQIYNAPTGGIAIWDNGFRKIIAANGLFKYDLGDSTALPYSVFTSDTNRWLGITVGADPEMTPRTKLNSVQYAYKASTADTANFSFLAKTSLDAPGFAASGISLIVPVTSTIDTVASVFFSAPANGYVLVISQSCFNNLTPANWIGGNLYRNGTYLVDSWYWEAGDPDGFYDQTQTWVSVDTVTASTLYNYSLNLYAVVGPANSLYGRVIVVYFPRRYDVLFKPFSKSGPISSGLSNLLGQAGLRPNEQQRAGQLGAPTTVNPATEIEVIKGQKAALDARIKRLEDAITKSPTAKDATNKQ